MKKNIAPWLRASKRKPRVADWDWRDQLEAEVAVAAGRMVRARNARWNSLFSGLDEFGVVTVVHAYIWERVWCWWHGVEPDDD